MGNSRGLAFILSMIVLFFAYTITPFSITWCVYCYINGLDFSSLFFMEYIYTGFLFTVLWLINIKS